MNEKQLLYALCFLFVGYAYKEDLKLFIQPYVSNIGRDNSEDLQSVIDEEMGQTKGLYMIDDTIFLSSGDYMVLPANYENTDQQPINFSGKTITLID